jgi:hypothetical protein
MAKKIKYVSDSPLEVGDKVICVKMDDEYSPVKPGTPGTVKSVSEVQGSKIYYVNWLGGSKLALLDGVDKWRKIVESDDSEEESINEHKIVLVRTKRDILNKNF